MGRVGAEIEIVVSFKFLVSSRQIPRQNWLTNDACGLVPATQWQEMLIASYARILRVSRIIRVEDFMSKPVEKTKQNLTIRLDRTTIKKAKVLAARKETSISGLVAQQIDSLVGADEAYEKAKQQAMALLDQGFHLGGVIRATRDELHER